MKIWWALALLVAAPCWAGDGFDQGRCSYHGIPLHGKVKVVENHGDIKVKVVTSFPDLKVKMVSNFPDDCGEWQAVTQWPDFTVQFVESFPDLKIKYVDAFPGVR